MEGLLSYDFSHNTLALQPGLAKSWSSTQDLKVWTFVLKKNIKWTDGKLFTAQHIIDGWERLLNPKTASEFAYFLYSIKNAKAYSEGKIKDFSKVGVQVNAQGNLVVELEEGKSYFPYFTAHTSTYPIRKDIIKKHTTRWTDPKNIVTLGAYRLKKWEHDKLIILEQNPLYYKPPVGIKNIIIYIIHENGTALSLFEKGRLDALGGLPSRELPALRQKKEYRSHPLLATYYFGMNVKQKPFNDVRVREAFYLAVDRKQITDLLKGDQIPLSSWIPKGLLGYNPSIGEGFNPEKAKKLIKEAGYENVKNFPRVVISYNTNEDHKRVAEKVQAQLKQNLNIQVELSNEEWKTYLHSVSTGHLQIYRMGWVADYPDPDNFMTLMTSYSENNHTNWADPKYDALVQQASHLLDKYERVALYNQAQKILVEKDFPVLPIYSAKSHWLISNRVKFFPLNIMGRIPFNTIRLK